MSSSLQTSSVEQFPPSQPPPSPPPSLVDALPSELLLNLSHYLLLPDLHRLARAARPLHALLSLHSQSIFRPRLLALGIPVFTAAISDPAAMLKDVIIWTGLREAAITRLQGLKHADEIQGEQDGAPLRAYFAAVASTVEGGSEATVRLLDDKHFIAGTTPSACIYSVDGPSTPFKNLDRGYVKWIDEDDSMIASAAEPSFLSLNEWVGPGYDGGHASIFDAADITRSQDSQPIYAGRIAKTSHSAFTRGQFLACCTAWWLLPEPELSNGNGADDQDSFNTAHPSKGEISLYKINSLGEPPTKLWSHSLPAGTRPRTLCISATHVHAAIDASPKCFILSLPIAPSDYSAGAPLTTLIDTSPLCLHAWNSVIVAQTPGEFVIYVNLGSFLHPIAAVAVGDVQRVALATHPHARDPVLLFRDICHPDRLCVIRPAQRTKKWFVAPKHRSGESGVWCLFAKDEKDVGVVWKPITT
ncbi:hypothetical protein HDU87_006014 [Geranomyces variabilis]|uniref:F-box domain-containing protein n=1 Tax=Geranomyces variabilis TaxID=109894 RepID=A0AAD5XV72_9FUNG|nr:hypothetical protein HDU87_006014 [Geranomyces variabilis]